ncbi:phospho-N-acetylmuramoyl-pentapeptide-transferase [Poriferisphaera sp. WC338]|uniref:phospho-N-acetylmuramoyl-pentapeptide- transferase n=1 Tax=Poriferisphaera sp. WC338 TaxID=3425129 RepID=UPI003D81732E
MIYQLYLIFREWINSHAVLGPLNVIQWVEFRAIMSIVLSFAIVVLFGKRTILWLVKQKVGDNPEFYHKDLNQLMKQKANTPTMGGVLIVGAIFATTLLLADLTSFYIRMALIATVAFCAIGFADDWLKLTSARRKPGSREGLYSHEKFLLQIGLAMILGLFIHHWGANKLMPDPEDTRLMSHALNLPFFKTWVKEAGDFVVSPNMITLSTVVFVVAAVLTITFFSNAVNLTDGMDGLASGTMVIVAASFMILAIIAGYSHQGFVLSKYLLVPYIPESDELAVVAGAMAGACLGFMWFNCHPAQVFMGDTGSLTLGGLIAFIAVVIRQEFLLFLIGGIFVFEAVSVMIQVGVFKLTKGRRRVFKCAPVHHHFHLLGWTEQQVVVRFWLLTGMFVAIALATIKLR